MRTELRRVASSIGTPSLLLTEREAAQLLSVSVNTLYLWRRAGTLAARIGRLEAKLPPPEPGCDRCRDHVLGEGDDTVRALEGREVCCCAACGEPVRGKIIEGVNIREAL